VIVSPAVEKVERLRAEYKRRADEVKANKDLTPAAAAFKLAEIRRESEEAVRALRREHEDFKVKQRGDIERKAFGPGYPMTANAADREAIVASYRGALDRVEAISSGEVARHLWQRAAMTGDRNLQRAIGWKAWQSGWADLVSEFAAAFPDAGQALSDLDTLRGEEGARAKMAESMTFSAGDF
jgi:hypothetical protein